jgi:hypothetical protein
MTQAMGQDVMNDDRERAESEAGFADGGRAAPPWRSSIGPGLDAEPEVGMARERRLEALNPAAGDWMLGLPLDVRPSCTAAWYPHVINRLCELWPQRELREAYFSELLFSKREGRRGFEALVMEELFDLQHFGTHTPSH